MSERTKGVYLYKTLIGDRKVYRLQYLLNGKRKYRQYPRTPEGLVQANLYRDYCVANGEMPPKLPKATKPIKPHRLPNCLLFD